MSCVEGRELAVDSAGCRGQDAAMVYWEATTGH